MLVKRIPWGGIAAAVPTVRFIAFTDLGVRVAINVRTQQFSDQAIVRHEVIKRLHPALASAGITVSTVDRGERKPETASRPPATRG